MRRATLLVCSLLLTLQSACGDDGLTTPVDDSGGTPDTDVVEDTDDAGDLESDNGEVDSDASEEVDGEPDAEADTGPICFEDRGERLVGDSCRRETDRGCLTNDHCIDSELCVVDEGETLGTCIYQIPDPIVCPGGEGCASNEGALRAAFAVRVITPLGWEEARAEYIDDDEIFVGDTLDPETFFDCGRDMICPDDDDYVAPDEDGSEGDEIMQGAWMAGLENSKPILRCTEEFLGESCELGLLCCAHERAHDDMLASGFVFEQGDSRVAFVVVDSIGYFYADLERARNQIDASAEIDLLIVSATHDHEAADTMGLWGPGSFGGDLPLETGVDLAHMEYVNAQIAELVEEAAANLVDVDFYADSVDGGVDGLAVRDSRDPWIFDDEMALLLAVRAGTDRSDPDNVIGAVVNWSNHPEAIGYNNQHISSDFPHYVREYVSNGLPAVMDGDTEIAPALPGIDAPVVYISGSVGGLITPLRISATTRDGTVIEENGYAKADAMGQRLAEFALEGLGAAPMVTGDLSFAMREFTTDVMNLQFKTGIFSLNLFNRRVYNWKNEDGFTLLDTPPQLRTAVARLQIGDVTFFTVPGELFPEAMVGGFDPDNTIDEPTLGDHRRMECMPDDLLPPEDGDNLEDATAPCLVSPDNPNPPDVASAPTGGYLRAEIPGETLFLIGLGMDEIGYLVPPYDFELLEGAEFVGEAEGDHYEETNSTGSGILSDTLRELEALFELDDGVLFPAAN